MEREQLIKLVTSAQSGKSEAMNELFSEFYNDVYYFALKTVKDSEIACDITQETFIEIINTIDKLKEPVAFVTWMKQITYHQCTRYFKKKKDVLVDEDEDGNTLFDSLVDESEDSVPAEVYEKEEFRKTILGMIDELSEEQRSAVMMYYFDEMPVGEISKVQEVSEGTVKSRLNYARKAIKKSVESYEAKYGIKLHGIAFMPLFRFFFEEESEKRHKSDSVEFDSVFGFIAFDGFFDSFSCVIKAAFYSPFRNFLNLGNFSYGHFIKIIHHYRGALFFAKFVYHSKNGFAEFLFFINFRRNGIFTFVNKGIKKGVSVLVLINKNVFLFLKIPCALMICNLFHPGYEGNRFFKFIDGVDYFYKGFLGDIAGDFGILYGFERKVINVVIKFGKKLVHGFAFSALGRGHKFYELFAFHFLNFLSFRFLRIFFYNFKHFFKFFFRHFFHGLIGFKQIIKKMVLSSFFHFSAPPFLEYGGSGVLVFMEIIISHKIPLFHKI